MRTAFVTVLLTLALPGLGSTCVCERVGPFYEVARHAKEVVVGEVIRHTDEMQATANHGGHPPFAMEVRVLEVLKGAPPMRFKVRGGFSSCNPSVTSFKVRTVWAFALLPGTEAGMQYVVDACVESTRRLSGTQALRAREVAAIRVKAGIQ